MRGRDAAATGGIAAALLLIVYIATLAPGVTFWDAGEFVAAAHTVGIPHPPGTPLFVLAGHVLTVLLGFLPTAVASNLLSAACSAAACGLGAWWIARSTGSRSAGLAAALCAGGMSSVWLNATETEVYAAALLLSALALWSAWHAGAAVGETPDDDARRGRWLLLTGYWLALAVPLHLSALVAAPAAAVLACLTPGRRVRGWWGVGLGAEALIVAAAGRAAPATAWIGGGLLLGIVVLALLPAAWRRALGARVERVWPDRSMVATAIGLGGVAVLGLSAALILLVRAAHDPAINQGNPSTWPALVDVLGRRQYAVPPPWPRQAPFWLQLANLLEYVDWQVALALGPGVAPTPWRTIATLLFLGLAVLGAAEHRRRDRRSFLAMLVLVASATIGVLCYLNMKPGPSIGYDLPGRWAYDGVHEARERDYFYALGFWGWGLWSGLGAVALVRRLAADRGAARGAAWSGVVLAALPVALNWSAMSRRREPDAHAAAELGRALLASAPRDAVLMVWGDNDTYPLWYAQQVEDVRRDVTVVTIPLLPAEWYRAELRRRGRLLEPATVHPWRGMAATEAAVAEGARRVGRPLAVAITAPARVRREIGLAPGARWVLDGLAFVERPAAEARQGTLELRPSSDDSAGDDRPLIDAAVTARIAARFPVPDSIPYDERDPVVHDMLGYLHCPRLALRAAGGEPDAAAAASLDSLCNFR